MSIFGFPIDPHYWRRHSLFAHSTDDVTVCLPQRVSACLLSEMQTQLQHLSNFLFVNKLWRHQYGGVLTLHCIKVLGTISMVVNYRQQRCQPFTAKLTGGISFCVYGNQTLILTCINSLNGKYISCIHIGLYRIQCINNFLTIYRLSTINLTESLWPWHILRSFFCKPCYQLIYVISISLVNSWPCVLIVVFMSNY